MLKMIIGSIGILTTSLLCGGCSDKASSKEIFEYNEIYIPEHGSDEYDDLGLDNLDYEWGIWGHNLSQIIPEGVSNTIYSMGGEGRDKKQYCFSSDELYNCIRQYIKDNFSSFEHKRFAILPNDNPVVCTCPKCTAAGNTHNDASPAVLKLIKRLAENFPEHLFFTSYYSTTKSLPKEQMPANVGVLISAIDFPLSTAETKKEQDFKTLLHDWSQKVNKVYVWDYINNFDDYFTPFPFFIAMQRRIRLYEKAGVEGLFMNGSGYDFSSLSRLKMYTLAAMLKNPDLDWRKYLKAKAKDLYPVTGELISNFMIEQEDFVASKGKELPIYDGINKAVDTYLPVDKFIAFHDALETQKKSAGDEERKDVDKIFKAMELTRLELMRKEGNIEGYEKHLKNLMSLKSDGINVYSESCWTLDSYCNEYKQIDSHAQSTVRNVLKGVRLSPGNGLDPEYSDISILTDGLLGMPSNYHNGLMINTPDEKWVINIPHVAGMNTLRVWLVTNPKFKIDLPKRINLLSGGNLIGTIVPTYPSGDKVGHIHVDFKVPASVGNLTLTLARDRERSPSMAIEEIEAF